MKARNICTIILLALFLVSCGKSQSSISCEKPIQDAPDTTSQGPVSHWDTIYTYKCKDGHSHIFCDVYGASWQYHLLFSSDENGYEDVQRVELVYHRYDSTNFLEEGNPCAFYYLPSPNRKNLYIITRVFANSNGWTTEYQLFKVNWIGRAHV